MNAQQYEESFLLAEKLITQHPPDFARAIPLLCEAAEAGHVEAAFQLAGCLFENQENKQDLAIAVEYLKQNNLALGGTLENAIVIKKDGVLNPEGLRFEDEFVRHKMLDIIGDLKILNRPIRAHIIAVKAGHLIDIEFAKILDNIK